MEGPFGSLVVISGIAQAVASQCMQKFAVIEPRWVSHENGLKCSGERMLAATSNAAPL